MKICVIGSGYVGLVTGACLADFGNKVTCVDKDRKKVKNLSKGVINFYELGLKELVLKNIASGRLGFDSDSARAIKEADVIFVAVGTPPLPNGEADLSAVEEVAKKIARIIRSLKGCFKVVVVKSTAPIGSTEYVGKIIRSAGVKSSKYEVVSNPEFLREGKAVADFLHPDRIVIGAKGKKACNIMAELYRPLNARIVFMDQRSSEMVKYASNVFLATRISLINELANICDRVGANIKNVVEGMGYDKRIGHDYLKPGLGYGGSCLPKDVSALTMLAGKKGYDAILLKSVHAVNVRQRESFSKKILELLAGIKGKTVGIWGLAFKPQTDDLRDAPSLTIINLLVEKGLKVKAYDPMTNGRACSIMPRIKYCQDAYEAAKGSDALVLMTEWNEFREADFAKVRRLMRQPIIIDGRNILNPTVLREHGIKYYGIGVRN